MLVVVVRRWSRSSVFETITGPLHWLSYLGMSALRPGFTEPGLQPGCRVVCCLGSSRLASWGLGTVGKGGESRAGAQSWGTALFLRVGWFYI